MNVARRFVPLLVLVLLAPFAHAQKAAPLEASAPADTLMEVYYQGLDQASKTFKGTALLDMLNEPEFQEFGAEIVRYTELLLRQNLPDPNMVTFNDIRLVLDSEMLLLIMNGDPEPEPVLIVRNAAHPADLRAFVNRLLLIATGGQEPEKIKGEAGEFSHFDDTFFGWLGDDFVMAPNMQSIIRIAAVRAGKSPALAANPTFAKLQKKAGAPSEFLRLYVDIRAIQKIVVGDEPLDRELVAVGLDSCSAAYASFAPDAPGTRFRAYALFPEGPKGVFKALPSRRLNEKNLLTGVPAGTSVMLSATSLKDLTDLINLFLSLNNQPSVNQILSMMLGFDPISDLSKSLGDEVLIQFLGPGLMIVPEFAVSVPVKDHDACRKTLDRLLTAVAAFSTPADPGPFGMWRPSFNIEVDRIQYKGTTIDAVKSLGFPLILAPSIGLSKDRLTLAAIPPTLKLAVNRAASQTPSLLNDPFFTASRSHVSPNPSFLAYTDPRKGLPLTYGGLITYFAQATHGIPNVPSHNLATRLPSSDALMPHLLGCCTALSWDGEGFLCESYGTLGGTLSVVGNENSGGLAQAGILAGFFVPAIVSAQESARRAACLNNEKQIMLALIQYAGDHDDKYPETLGILLKERYLNTHKVFICPSSGRGGQFRSVFPPGNLADLPLEELRKIDELADFVLVKGVSHADDADTIIIYEKNGAHGGEGRNVGFNDGHVKWYPEHEFQRLLAAQNERLARKRPPAM